MRHFLIAILIFIAGAASAQDRGFPALYDVSGVASHDVLNVRSGPGVAHGIIGSFAPNHRNVEVVGTTEDGRWGRVIYGEVSGWTSMRFLSRTGPDYAAGLPAPLLCFGNEPFWSLDRQAGTAIFDSVRGSGPESYTEIWSDEPAGRGPYAFGLLLQSRTAQISAFISRSICSDGMSDRDYGFSIHLIHNSPIDGISLLDGCCVLAR